MLMNEWKKMDFRNIIVVADKVGKEGFDINEFVAANPASALAPYYIMRNLAWGLDLEQLQTLRSKWDKSLDGNM